MEDNALKLITISCFSCKYNYQKYIHTSKIKKDHKYKFPLYIRTYFLKTTFKVIFIYEKLNEMLKSIIMQINYTRDNTKPMSLLNCLLKYFSIKRYTLILDLNKVKYLQVIEIT